MDYKQAIERITIKPVSVGCPGKTHENNIDPCEHWYAFIPHKEDKLLDTSRAHTSKKGLGGHCKGL